MDQRSDTPRKRRLRLIPSPLCGPRSQPIATKGEFVMKNVIVITGASSGFGSLASHALARAGHAVYAGMRETRGRNAPQVEEAKRFSKEYGVDLRTVEMDVSNQPSVDAAVKVVIKQQGRIGVLIHNAGPMVF